MEFFRVIYDLYRCHRLKAYNTITVLLTYVMSRHKFIEKVYQMIFMPISANMLPLKVGRKYTYRFLLYVTDKDFEEQN